MLVFPRSSSLAGSCWLTGSTQEICWEEEGNSCRKATTAPCVRMVWKRLQNIFSFSAPLLSADGLHWGSPGTSIITSTKSFTLQKNEFRQPFLMDIFFIGAWCLWNERNDYIFKNKPPSLATWKASVKDTVTNHLIRIKQCYHSSILQWLDAL